METRPTQLQNKYQSKFQGHRGIKLWHSKVKLPNKISLSYPQCFNVSIVHPLVRVLFSLNSTPEVLLARRLKFFYSNWAELMQDLKILNIVHGFEILFLENSVQGKPPNPPLLNQKQSKLVKEERKEMLLKGEIQPVSPFKNQYLSNLFLVSKRDGGNRPIIIWNIWTIPSHSSASKWRDWIYYKICSRKKTTSASWTKKDDYFWFSLKKETRKYIRFHWEVTFYQFLCLCFGLSPATLIFTKIWTYQFPSWEGLKYIW